MEQEQQEKETMASSEPLVDQKPTDSISLRVVAQDGAEVLFKIRKTTQLKKLFVAYCQRRGVDESSIRFFYDGKRVTDSDTPTKLEMEENDIIDALLQQVGGLA